VPVKRAVAARAAVSRLLCCAALVVAVPGVSGPVTAAPGPDAGSLSVPFRPAVLASPIRVSLQDAAGQEVGAGTASGGQLTLGAATPGRVFPPCTGSGAALAGLLVGTVATGSGPGAVAYRPVPVGLRPGAEPSGAPGKGGALLYLRSASKGVVEVNCTQRGALAFRVALDGRFPVGWSRVRVTVSVVRAAGAFTVVRLTPEAGEWRWERTVVVPATR